MLLFVLLTYSNQFSVLRSADFRSFLVVVSVSFLVVVSLTTSIAMMMFIVFLVLLFLVLLFIEVVQFTLSNMLSKMTTVCDDFQH